VNTPTTQSSSEFDRAAPPVGGWRCTSLARRQKKIGIMYDIDQKLVLARWFAAEHLIAVKLKPLHAFACGVNGTCFLRSAIFCGHFC
ncbi:MAG: hypothetical protein ABIO19_15300, partial [Burkholderiaceae bacterium]